MIYGDRIRLRAIECDDVPRFVEWLNDPEVTAGLYIISLLVYNTNPRAGRAYEKAGFTREGTLRQAIYRNGRYIDSTLMSILRSEWEALKGEARHDS